MLGKLFGNSEKEELLKAKQEFEEACNADKETREGRATQVRISLRCRAVLDKTFIEGAEKTAEHSEACMVALAAGEDKPKPPTPRAFQQIKSVNGDIWAYIPLEAADEVFKIGAAYQLEEVSAEQAIELAQAVADKISEQLRLDQPFEALGFLKEQLAEESDEANEEE